MSMVLPKYQNCIEMTSNMINIVYIVVYTVDWHRIHLNAQCEGGGEEGSKNVKVLSR